MTFRWEALSIAAFGLAAALPVGTFFGWVMVQALEEEGAGRGAPPPPARLRR